MMFKVWLINIILALCAVFIGKSAYSVWHQEERSSLAVPFKASPRSDAERRRTKGPPPLMESSYEIIAARNLFSADRAEYLPLEATTGSEKPPVPGKKINLYGVIIMDSSRKALIDNPERKSDEPRRKWVSIGDTLGNMTITAIEPESVLLKEGIKQYMIPLYDEDEKEKGRSFSESNLDRSSSSPTIVKTDTQKDSSDSRMISGTNKKKGTTEPGAKNQDNSTEGYKIIQTPFGNVKRRTQ